MEVPLKKNRITPEMYASKSKRFVNFLIDYIAQTMIGGLFGVLLVVFAEITGNYGFVEWIENMNKLEEYLVGFIILILYYMIFETLTGRTLGKFITNTKIVTENGEKPEMDKILYRTFSRMIPFEPLSFFGSDDRGWHDTISKTVVVDIKKYNQALESYDSIDEIGKEQE